MVPEKQEKIKSVILDAKEEEIRVENQLLESADKIEVANQVRNQLRKLENADKN